jgi:four helix bundle protein
MTVQKFEDIKAWQKAREMTLCIYLTFKNNKDFRFRDQIQSASVSIMNNIAEGFERRSRKDFSHFLYIAKASCAEVKSMLYLSIDLKYVSKEEFDKISSLSIEISKMLSSFIKALARN